MSQPATPDSPVTPLKPVVFEILLVLLDGERHGWNIVRELERRSGGTVKILPGNLDRSLREMLAAGLIEESDKRPDPALDDQRRRYFKVTHLGRDAARAEAARLEALVTEARALKLLASRKS